MKNYEQRKIPNAQNIHDAITTSIGSVHKQTALVNKLFVCLDGHLGTNSHAQYFAQKFRIICQIIMPSKVCIYFQ